MRRSWIAQFTQKWDYETITQGGHMADNPKKHGKDGKTISNQDYELAYAAKKAGVKKEDVKKAKAETKSTRRTIIESELNKLKPK